MTKKIILSYITINLINGKQYVGSHSTHDINDSYLGSGRLMLKAIKKYGKENFNREVVCIHKTLKEAYINEGYLILLHDTCVPNGYNISPTGGTGMPHCFSEETRDRLSKINTGNIMSAGARAKMSKAQLGVNNNMYGKRHSKETLAKMSKANSGENHGMYGKFHSEEAKSNISKAHTGSNHHMYGRFHSEETKAKMSEAHKGERAYNFGKHLSAETKALLSKANIGRPVSKETRAKLSKAGKGRVMSENTKAKLSKANSGENHYSFGKELSKEHKAKISASLKNKKIKT